MEMVSNGIDSKVNPVKQWLLSPIGVVLFGVVVTLFAYIDTTHAPWSPYIVIYGALSILVPMWLGVVKWRATKLNGKLLWRLTFMVTCVAVFFDSGVWTIGYNWLLAQLSMLDEKHSIVLATLKFVEVAGKDLHLTPTMAEAIFAAFIILWAPVGEEMLYRAYIYDAIKSHYGIVAGFIVASFFFCIRHTIHFMYIWPGFSFAGVAWAFAMVFFAACATYLYERAGGIFVVVIMHFVVNVVGSIVGSL